MSKPHKYIQRQTKKRKQNNRSLRKKIITSTKEPFDKEITLIFLEMLMMVKLFHWKTTSYATHKATDDLYDTLNGHIDKFIEVLIGKTGKRIDLTNHKTLSLVDLTSSEQLIKKVEWFKSYLVDLSEHKMIGEMTNSDLLNIRDEILADMNQFLYLLTFK